MLYFIDMRPSAAEVVRTAVAMTPVGEPFASRNFLSRGRPGAVQKALERLAQAGVIRRVAQGVFVRPERSPHIKGEVPAEVSKVAKAVAERSGAIIQVHGAEAARQMGFSTQVPMQTIFLTSGPNKKIMVGNLVVRLKHACPRKLALAGRPAGVALAALWYLGKREVEPVTFGRIEHKIGPAEFTALTGARLQMPGWMLKALDQFEQTRSAG
jgi:Family of unknown function (DUF6088)